MKRQILIVFPDEWLSHSPTVLNLYNALHSNFDVRIISVNDGAFRNNDLVNKEIIFIQVPNWIARFLLRRVRAVYSVLKACLLLVRLSRYRKSYLVDEVIAVDSVGLWTCQRIFGKCHFLSLEVQKDFFFRRCSPDGIKSFIIQTPERLSALSNSLKAPTFYIQNAPSLKNIDVYQYQKSKFNGKLIYLGNILPSHGILHVLDAFSRMAQDGLELTIKGVIYKGSVRRIILKRYQNLFKRGILFLDESYTPQEKLIEYLSRFGLGFCLYDFNLLNKNNFNYLSSPSGKLFNYYAAGVPVIGTDVLGLKSIRQFNTGVLLSATSAESICTAVVEIVQRYAELSRNCIYAAAHYDFDRASVPLIEFFKSAGSGNRVFTFPA